MSAFRLVSASFAVVLVAGCGGNKGGGGKGDAATDASGDAGPDASTGKPCNGSCSGVCRGVCAGVCSERAADGECRAPCSGVCVGMCEGTCSKVVRWDASFAPPPDARRDAAADASIDAGTAIGWTDRTRPSSLSWPPAAHAGAVVFEARRSRVVMFGGLPGEVGNATWEWDGAAGTWLQRQQLGGARPAARSGHALVYDSDRGKVVLTGGIDAGGSSLSDVWEWDGAAETWTERAPGPRPSRWGHATVYDVARKRIVLFGGSYRHASLGDGDLFDTWEYDGAADAWQNRTYPLPPSWPRPRRGHAMAYDEARGVTVLHGGEVADAPGATTDLWEWDGVMGRWTDRTTAGPGLRAFAGLASTGDGRLLLFGNLPPNLWQWTGQTATWQSLTGGGAWPPARARSLVAWDPGRRVLVLVGGSVAVGRTALADTWERPVP